MQIVDGLKTGFRNLPKVEKCNYWLIQHLWSSSRQHMMCVASSCLRAPPTHLKHTLEEMTRSLEGSPVRPGLGHQSTLGQSELWCGGVGYKDIWRPRGAWLESDLRRWRGSQYHQCLHYPETAETPQPCKAEKSRTRRNQRTRMWSNNGAGQQRGHLGLAAASSSPAECMTIAHHCSTFFTAFYGVSGAQCGPAPVCEENAEPLAILPFPVFSGKHQPSGTRSHTWTLGLTANLTSLFHTVWAETCIQVE